MGERRARSGWGAPFSGQARVLLTIVLVCAFVFPLFVFVVKFTDTLSFLLDLYRRTFDFTLPSAWVYVLGVSVLLAVCLCATYVRYRRAVAREAALADVLNSISPDVLLVLGPDGKVVMSNRALQRMFGYDEEDIRGRPREFIAPDQLDAPPPHHDLQAFLTQEGFSVRYATGKRKDGGTLPLEVITGQLQARNGEVLLLRDITERLRAEREVLQTKEDLEQRVVERTAALVQANWVLRHEITERRLAEEERERLREQLLQARKLEAIGLLAGGVAHDFNNLLTVILGHLELATDLAAGQEDMRHQLSLAGKGCARAAEMVHQLLHFSRRAPLAPVPVDLNGVVTGLREMLASLVGEKVEVVVSLCPEPWLILGDAASLERVLTNLAVNARDAMPAGGVIRISTANVCVTDGMARAMSGARPGRFVCVRVEDTGTGMTPEVLSRLFEPFFTTKKPGAGTGLGLAGAYGTIRQHEGWIDVWSEVGKGSCFSLYLPEKGEGRLTDTSVALPASAALPVSPAAAHPGGTVLVVEDDEAVRRLVLHHLTRQGHTVLQAADVKTALEVLRRQGSGVDLVFTDTTLPDGTGLDVVDEVRRSWPQVRLLLTTGQGSGRKHGLDLRQLAVPFIGKPYTLDQLATTVAGLLRPTAAPG